MRFLPDTIRPSDILLLLLLVANTIELLLANCHISLVFLSSALLSVVFPDVIRNDPVLVYL